MLAVGGALALGLAAYPTVICLFRFQTKELGYSKHDWALPFLAASAGLAWWVVSHGPSVLSTVASVAVVAYTYRWQVLGPAFKPVDMRGKVCVVTGSSSGIGYATAEELLRMGAHVVLACRSEKKALAARTDMFKACPGTNGTADFMALDLSSFASVRAFAAAYKARGLPLHVLVNNAGLMQFDRRVTPDGHELTMQANYLGHFLLTNLLLDVLKKTPGESRIVNISSSMHWAEKHFDFDDMQSERSYSMFKAYEQSKLAQLLSTMELDRQVAGSGVTVNAVHPGGVVTDVTRGVHPILRWMEQVTPFIQYCLRKPRRVGAWTAVHCACSPEVSGMSGKYFWNCREELRSPLVDDRTAQEKLWDVTERLVAEPDGAGSDRAGGCTLNGNGHEVATGKQQH